MPLQLKECCLMPLVNLQVKPVFKTSFLCAFRSFYFEICPKTIATTPPVSGCVGSYDTVPKTGKGVVTSNGGFVYTKQQIAEKLSVSVATVNRLIQSGALESVRIRRCVRISNESFSNFIQDLGGSDES